MVFLSNLLGSLGGEFANKPCLSSHKLTLLINTWWNSTDFYILC
uniref:Uncharacterized protein n=1 Tax=Rhizophora mucronata TaxID=61149 RepID=A0A2P2N779_RHIMU